MWRITRLLDEKKDLIRKENRLRGWKLELGGIEKEKKASMAKKTLFGLGIG
jgi:hypothetical protein